jgi:hypothetical protein
MNIRKCDFELSVSDLIEYPVWEFAFGEKDEIIKMKPSNKVEPYDISLDRYLVRSTYILANGVKKIGYIKPINTKDTFMGHLSPVDLSPVLLTDFGQIGFLFGPHKPLQELLNQYYSWLGYKPIEISPIKVSSDVELINGIGKGVLEGFLYCIDNEVTDYFHMEASELRVII